MALAQQNHAFLFQIRPDIFPEGYLTDCELSLWGMHYEARAAAMKEK